MIVAFQLEKRAAWRALGEVVLDSELFLVQTTEDWECRASWEILSHDDHRLNPFDLSSSEYGLENFLSEGVESE